MLKKRCEKRTKKIEEEREGAGWPYISEDKYQCAA
jgi:hypothetical protein